MTDMFSRLQSLPQIFILLGFPDFTLRSWLVPMGLSFIPIRLWLLVVLLPSWHSLSYAVTTHAAIWYLLFPCIAQPAPVVYEDTQSKLDGCVIRQGKTLTKIHEPHPPLMIATMKLKTRKWRLRCLWNTVSITYSSHLCCECSQILLLFRCIASPTVVYESNAASSEEEDL